MQCNEALPDSRSGKALIFLQLLFVVATLCWSLPMTCLGLLIGHGKIGRGLDLKGAIGLSVFMSASVVLGVLAFVLIARLRGIKAPFSAWARRIILIAGGLGLFCVLGVGCAIVCTLLEWGIRLPVFAAVWALAVVAIGLGQIPYVCSRLKGVVPDSEVGRA